MRTRQDVMLYSVEVAPTMSCVELSRLQEPWTDVGDTATQRDFNVCYATEMQMAGLTGQQRNRGKSAPSQAGAS